MDTSDMGPLEREALELYGDAVPEMGGMIPWSKPTLYEEDARMVRALRVIRGAAARLSRR